MNEIFSVIVLCYNNQIFMEDCLSTILAQDYPAIEIILADDCSRQFEKQTVVDYIENNKKTNIVNYLIYSNEKNFGTVKSINRALEKAKGKYFKLIAIDDAFYDEHVLSEAKKALDLSGDGIVLGTTINCDEHLKVNDRKLKFPPEQVGSLSSKDLFKKLCETNIIDATGVFFNRDFLHRYGLFDEKYRLLEDWPKWLEITYKGCSIPYFPYNVVNYRCDCGSGTGTNKFELQDKKTAFDEFVVSNWKLLGPIYFLKCYVRFLLTTSLGIRKLYSLLFRKKM